MWQTNTTSNLVQQNAKSLGEVEGKKCPKTEWRSTGRSLNIQIPRRSHKQQRQPLRPHNRDRKEGQGSHRRYPCRNRQHWIQRNKDKSHMANGGCHNHPNNDLLMWGVVRQQRRDKKLQTFFNEALKTILYLPQGTPTTILLNETGNLPIKYIIKKKQILQAKRIDEMKEESLIKDATKTTHSIWSEKVEKTAEELPLKDLLLITNKNSLKRLIQDEISTKILDDIENETQNKTKVKHWKERKDNILVGKRPEYMDKLTRKQCNAIIKTRSSMLAAKANFKRANETNPACRFCAKEKETQEHVLQHCPKVENRTTTIEYQDIFKEDTERLKEIAAEIIRIEEEMKGLSDQQK